MHAIWSPSKSALNAAHTSGCSWIAFALDRTVEGLDSSGAASARGSADRVLAMTSSQMSHDGLLRFDHLLGGLIVVATHQLSLLKMNG